jgi:hypothetical protein
MNSGRKMIVHHKKRQKTETRRAALFRHPGARCREPKQLRRAPEGASQFVTNCHQLKLRSLDGKSYKTDACDLETLLHTKRRPLTV